MKSPMQAILAAALLDQDVPGDPCGLFSFIPNFDPTKEEPST